MPTTAPPVPRHIQLTSPMSGNTLPQESLPADTGRSDLRFALEQRARAERETRPWARHRVTEVRAWLVADTGKILRSVGYARIVPNGTLVSDITL